MEGGVVASIRPGEDERVVLGLLESVEQDGGKSQRRLAAELGIALGLVNAYLNRCIQKGLVKVSQAPARRYAYYLTPQGFVEKSRLSLEYLTYSFRFFRQARLDCQQLSNSRMRAASPELPWMEHPTSRKSPQFAHARLESRSSPLSMSSPRRIAM